MSEKTKSQRLSLKQKYELIEGVKAGAMKEFTLNKYRITDRQGSYSLTETINHILAVLLAHTDRR